LFDDSFLANSIFYHLDESVQRNGPRVAQIEELQLGKGLIYCCDNALMALNAYQ